LAAPKKAGGKPHIREAIDINLLEYLGAQEAAFIVRLTSLRLRIAVIDYA
jgi:hypothetical protein